MIAISVFTLMTTWSSGRQIVQGLLERGSLPIDLFLGDVEKRKPFRAPGTAVFMARDPEGAPLVLLHHMRHNKTLLEHVVLLSILSENVPKVPDSERISVTDLGLGFWRVTATEYFAIPPNRVVELGAQLEM